MSDIYVVLHQTYTEAFVSVAFAEEKEAVRYCNKEFTVRGIGYWVDSDNWGVTVEKVEFKGNILNEC